MKPLRPTAKQMSSPIWRLTHIYTIQSRDATGKDAGPIAFRPTPEQMEVINAIYILGWEFIIIPKSRQLGMSTVIEIIILDSILFGAGVQCSIVDKKEDDATKKLNGKIKYAFDAMPVAMRSGWEVVKANDGEFTLRKKGTDMTAQSSVFASVSSRGGTNHILHISEWGEVQMKDKRRSLEILTGSLPTADHPGCVTIVETTWKGGKTGELWPLVAEALKIPEAQKGPKDKRVLFFGWWTNPNNSDAGDPSQITAETHEYCDKAERMIARRLDNGQRLWWQKKKKELGIHMMSEHPTTMDECFEAPHEGAFFDSAGLHWQQIQTVPLETRIQHGNINVQGRGAFWVPMRASAEIAKKAPFLVLEQPEEGESYLMPMDFCVGKQAAGSTGVRDTNAYGVIRAGRLDPVTHEYKMPMVVATCQPDDRFPTHETIQRAVALHRYYGDCLVVPEMNNMGNICGQLEAAGVTNIWTQRQGADGAIAGVGKREEVKGWLTNAETRKQILDNLQQRTQDCEYIAAFGFIHHQLTTFILDKHGKAQAASGEFDDWVMFLAIGLFCLPSATPYKSPGLRSAQIGRAGFDPEYGRQDARGL